MWMPTATSPLLNLRHPFMFERRCRMVFTLRSPTLACLPPNAADHRLKHQSRLPFAHAGVDWRRNGNSGRSSLSGSICPRALQFRGSDRHLSNTLYHLDFQIVTFSCLAENSAPVSAPINNIAGPRCARLDVRTPSGTITSGTPPRSDSVRPKDFICVTA